MSGYEIRPFESIEEFRACVALQEETWGHGFTERVPTAILMVAQKLGGVAAGAYAEDGTLAGFVFGMTGVTDGEIVHWSDMLAVRRGIRDSNLGSVLKAYQRRVLLDQGVETMRWTFDPLQARNAYLNFSKLGIVAHEYVQDMYGHTGSPLHQGIGTDRFVALWRMNSDRVRRRVEGGERGPAAEAHSEVAVALAERDVEDALPHPADPVLDLDGSTVRIAVPADISTILADSMESAVAWREATRMAFRHYLDRGYWAREFLRGPRTSDYLMERRDPS